jgi:hypothetical protein
VSFMENSQNSGQVRLLLDENIYMCPSWKTLSELWSGKTAIRWKHISVSFMKNSLRTPAR